MVFRRVLAARNIPLCLGMILLTVQSFGQGIFTLRQVVHDGGGGVDTLLFGRDPRGTYCVDQGIVFYEGTRTFTEFELPPAPPSGVFDGRWSNHRPGLGGCTQASERGNGMKYDIRGLDPPGQVDTFQIRFQVGNAGPITLGWQQGLNVFADSMRIKDLFTGTIVNVDMFGATSAVITNLALNTLVVLVYGSGRVALVAPADGAVVAPEVMLSWDAVPNATIYRLQVSTDSLFTEPSIIVHDSTLTGTSRLVSGLSGPGTFYWRVAAGRQQGWGGYSIRRSLRTGSVPPAPSLIAPDDGATNQPSSLMFQWTAIGEASAYHLQIASDSTFASGFAFNDTSVTDTFRLVSGLGFSTTFFWRVASRNDVGSGPFTPMRRFTTQLQPPPAPTLISPPDGQSGLPPTLTLTWQSVGAGSVTYRLQIATNAGFTTIVFDDSTITGTSRLVSLATNTQHFWRISATNLAGTGPNSATWTFTTAVAPPPAPGLVLPPDAATNVDVVPTLTWNPVATATSYRLQVALDTSFTQIAFDDSTISGTSRQVGPLVSNSIYHWRVSGKNAGGSGPYSPRFRFTTTAAPPAPVQVYPPDSASLIPQSFRFVWIRVPGATGYALQVATSAAFTTLLVNDSTITDSTRLAGPFPYGARLYWRLRSRNTSGSSVFSPTRTFTVMLQPPSAPTLASPANNAVGLTVTPLLRWQGAPLAAFYRAELALDTLMTNIAIVDSGITDTARTVRVAPNTAYYWRIRGQNTEGTFGPYSGIRRFTTGNFAPASPVPFAPANGDSNVSRTPRLRWLASPGTLHYRVQVSLDNLFTQMVSEDSLVPSTDYFPGLLAANTTYYWRTRARGTAGWSAYSVIQRFTTGELIVSVGDEPATTMPAEYVLHQNYPNPFNPNTTIRYDVGNNAHVTVQVHNLLGQQVAILASGQHAPASYTVVWHAQDGGNRPLPSGIYLVRMTAVGDGANEAVSRLVKVVLMK